MTARSILHGWWSVLSGLLFVSLAFGAAVLLAWSLITYTLLMYLVVGVAIFLFSWFSFAFGYYIGSTHN